MLMDAGCAVSFPDFEGSARHDLDVVAEEVEFAVECKAISADAGRKVRRRDFYRFMSMITPTLLADQCDESDVVVVTVNDRFPTSRVQQEAIAQTVYDNLAAQLDTERIYEGHSIQRQPTTPLAVRAAGGLDFGAACRKQYGQDCHVAGGMGSDGRGHLVVVRSRREDDTSKPALEARKAAVKQLPTDRMGVVALQYEEIEVQDLSMPHFRRRLGILDNYMFHELTARHLAAVYHCAYAGLHGHEGSIGKPAFVTWAPAWSGEAAKTPLHAGVSNSRFAEILGATEADPDDHIYG